MSEHGASNSRECLTLCTGRTIVGVLYGPAPLRLTTGSQVRRVAMFVLDDGTGFTFNDNGTFWRVREMDVKRELGLRRDELRAAATQLSDVLHLAGEPTGGNDA